MSLLFAKRIKECKKGRPDSISRDHEYNEGLEDQITSRCCYNLISHGGAVTLNICERLIH